MGEKERHKPIRRSRSISPSASTGSSTFHGPLRPLLRRSNVDDRRSPGKRKDDRSGHANEDASSSNNSISTELVSNSGFTEQVAVQTSLRPAKMPRIHSLPSEQEFTSSMRDVEFLKGQALEGSNLQECMVKLKSGAEPIPKQEGTCYGKPPLSLSQKESFAWLGIFILIIFVMLYALTMRDQALSFEKEVIRMQEELLECSVRCKFCREADLSDPRYSLVKEELEAAQEFMQGRGNRNYALFVLLFFLAIPFVSVKFMDKLLNFGGGTGNVSVSTRLAYQVDVLFSSYSYVKPASLLLATLVLIIVGGVALYGVSDHSIWESFWLAWGYVADSGNHVDNVGLGPRIVSLCISLGGLLIFALMLGLISDAISEKVDSLRKGKSEVIETNHTLILGWSDKLGSLVKQLAIANQSLGGGVVVVLAERDKEQMELDIAKLEFEFMGTSVICRSGSPLIMADLKKVSVSNARAIIVLAEVENADQSDARALRVVLSLTGVKEGLKGHVVVELSDLDNEPLVKLVGGDMVETVVAHDVIGRLMIQCARQPGLAQIWEDILGFDNAEFYVKRWPQLDGMAFGNVLLSFPGAVPCGIRMAYSGKIVLNPEDDYILREGDQILVIAEDDDAYSPAPTLPKVKRPPYKLDIRRSPRVPKKILLCGWRRDVEDMITVRSGPLPTVLSHRKYPEKLLFCGWRRDMHDMIMVLEAFLAPKSELWMFSGVPEAERSDKLLDGGLDPSSLVNIKLIHRQGNAVIRRHLEMLPLETFDSILILADESLEDSVVKADSRSLATLLLIRDIQSKRLPYKETPETVQFRQPGISRTSWISEMQQASNKSIIISEILDSRTRHLVSVSQIGDYVLSNELVSMALAMVAEDKQINRVLEELFSEEGNELYIRSAELYLHDQEELSFFETMVRARERHEIVIGYRAVGSQRAIINPPIKHVKRRWSSNDLLIVIAEDE